MTRLPPGGGPARSAAVKPENVKAAAQEGSGLEVEFAKLFQSLSPDKQNEIIAEMLKRQRENKA